MNKRALTWLGALASIASTVYFVRAIATHWQSLSAHAPHLAAWPAVAAALLLYLATYASGTRAWQLSLQSLGTRVGFGVLARVLMLSQFAKYLPGNVGHHVGRVMLARRAGMEADCVIASMLLDTFMALLAGAACSLPALSVLIEVVERHGAGMQTAAMIAFAIGVLLVAAVFAVPAMRGNLASIARRVGALRSADAGKCLVQAWAAQCMNFLCGAAALYLLCHALSPPEVAAALPANALRVLGLYAAAWLVGFLMPGAPAGLGLRELVLLLGLTPMVGAPQAMIAAAVLRLVTTVGDGLAFAAGFALDRDAARRAHA